MGNSPDKQSRKPSSKKLRFWLLGASVALLLLLLSVRLFAGHVLSTAAVKHKIQHSVVMATGIEVDWQSAVLHYFPYPAIVLKNPIITTPDYGHSRAAELHISLEFLPLLLGDLRLARLELQQPEISLNLPVTEHDKIEAHENILAELSGNLPKALVPLAQVAPNFDLFIHDGKLSIGRGEKQKVEIENLDLDLGLSINGPNKAQLKLQGNVALLSIPLNGKRQTIKDAKLKGVVGFKDGELSVSIERLAIVEPALQLTGTGHLASAPQALTLSLDGSDIDVDAIRGVVLALAGHIPTARGIFDYVRGGLVPQINFTSQGKTLSEFGDLKNMLIKGQLQQGKISIPEISLDMTEVHGAVLISEGVLQGDGLSVSLSEATGHDGALKIGLVEDNNIFSLELMLNADLAQAQAILKKIVKNGVFSEEIDKITNLQGISTGKLILGDSLADINARVDITTMNLVADYQRVPFPIVMSKGQLSFAKNRIVLKGLSGKLGASDFAEVNCSVDWKEALRLELASGQFDLTLDELYPWVSTFDGAKEYLNEIKKVGGSLGLSTASFKGTVGKPAQWQYAATGAVKALSIDPPHFPARINFAKGAFKLDAKQLSFQNFKTAGLDTNLVLSGALKGFPQHLNQLELNIDGTIGQNSIVWLRDLYKLPESYTVRAPLSLSKAQVTWQSEAPMLFKGDISVTKGPDLTLDVIYSPGQLHLKQLTIKDPHSDAHMAFSQGKDEISLTFKGTLQHKTLQALFVEQSLGKGSLQGDLSVKIPLMKQTVATANGHLTGESLVLPLSGGHNISIEQIVLDATGPQGKADVTTLSWNDLIWDSVKADLDFNQDQIKVSIVEGNLCGIKCPGGLTIAGTDLALDFALAGQGLDVARDYACLTKSQVQMTGALDFTSQISAQGAAEELLGSLQGPLDMTFTNGVVSQSKLLSRVLAVLNVTEIVKGKLPNLASTGFAYSDITVQGKFQEGKLLVEKLYMDGETLDIYGKGELDLQKKTVNIELLAAPFKTVDSVVKKIPGVNYLLAGSLVAIPVSVKGAMDDPKVKVVSASSVGSSLLGMGARILKSPIKLIQTITPGKKDKEP